MENFESEEVANDLQKEKYRKEAFILNNSGLEKYKNVNFDDAISDYTKAIELYKDFDVAYYNRGTVLYRLGLYENAFQDLLKAVKLNPLNFDFLNAFKDCTKMINYTKNT